jgi:hypothetical protein
MNTQAEAVQDLREILNGAERWLAANFESAPWLVCEHQRGFFSAHRSVVRHK